MAYCLPCTPGSYGATDAMGFAVCLACLPGTYTNTTSKTTCDVCPTGRSSNVGSMSCFQSTHAGANRAIVDDANYDATKIDNTPGFEQLCIGTRDPTKGLGDLCTDDLIYVYMVH